MPSPKNLGRKTNTRTRENTNLLSRRLGQRNHVVISILCIVVTSSVGQSRRRDNWRVNSRCNSPIRRNNRDLVWHGERRKVSKMAQQWPGKRKNAKLMTGERLTKRELNRPIYTKPVWNRTCRRLRAQGNFYPWIPARPGAFVRDRPSENRLNILLTKKIFCCKLVIKCYCHSSLSVSDQSQCSHYQWRLGLVVVNKKCRL